MIPITKNDIKLLNIIQNIQLKYEGVSENNYENVKNNNIMSFIIAKELDDELRKKKD